MGGLDRQWIGIATSAIAGQQIPSGGSINNTASKRLAVPPGSSWLDAYRKCCGHLLIPSWTAAHRGTWRQAAAWRSVRDAAEAPACESATFVTSPLRDRSLRGARLSNEERSKGASVESAKTPSDPFAPPVSGNRP